MKIVDREEASRKVIGLSAARLCVFVRDICETACADTPHVTDAASIHKVFKARGMNATWTSETIKRYWGLGKRLRQSAVLPIIDKFEYFYGRESIVDQISTLRALVGAADTDTELAYLLQILFLEQRSKLRTSLPSMVGANRYIFHAVLLRPVLMSYMCGRFPEFLRELLYSVCRKFSR